MSLEPQVESLGFIDHVRARDGSKMDWTEAVSASPKVTAIGIGSQSKRIYSGRDQKSLV
jgi:hypothetical protein